jgi:predicted TPR repeat methyltransferase
MPARLFLSSGDLIADRRFEFARDLQLKGDLPAAADLLEQAVELAPNFPSAWFTLGEIRVELKQHDAAIAAFRRARESDPRDRHGAAVWLMRLGAEGLGEMPKGYVQALFDQYAPRFEAALLGDLGYRAGAFHKEVDHFIGIDLSPGMIEQARATGLYKELEVNDMVEGLRSKPDASANLLLAADAMCYVGDIAPVLKAAKRVLTPGGVFAFTLETHRGEGVMLGEGLRYAHAAEYVRGQILAAGLAVAHLEQASPRNEDNEPVQGLVVVAAKT